MHSVQPYNPIIIFFMRIIRIQLYIFLAVLLVNTCSHGQSEPNEIEEPKNESAVLRGRVHSSNQGIAGVIVTDGFNFALTDDSGNYSLSSGLAATHVYISSPSGYSVPVENSVPQYYISLENVSNRQDLNFELIRSATSDQKHYCIAVGDPQVRNEEELLKLKPILDGMKANIKSKNMNPVHLMVAGDIVFDTPLVHDQSKSYFSTVGQPVYYAIGNHDHIQNKKQAASDLYDKTAADVFKGHYGPTYYSFNRGEVHYVVLDNILYRGGPDTDYSTFITREQLEWLKKDLSYVPKNKVIFVMLHSPTKSRYQSNYGNSAELHQLLTGYKEVHIISGHTHYNSVMLDGSGITEHTVGAVCGGWWEGPVCPCGTYLGYKIFEIDGTSVQWKYRAHQFPEKQFSVFKPTQRADDLSPAEELLVNVWDWDTSWTVNWSDDNGTSFKEMHHPASRVYDPLAFEYFGASGDKTFPPGRTWIGASPTDHIFTCIPSEGTTKVIIKVTNHFGEEFTEEVSL